MNPGNSLHLSVSEILQLCQGRALDSESAGHAAGCSSCSRELELAGRWAELVAQFQTEGGAPRGPSCPSLETLGLLAAGLVDEMEPAVLDHIAECQYCGPLLREVSEETPSAEEFPRQSAQWVQETAAAMAQRFRRPSVAGFRGETKLPTRNPPYRFYLALAATILVAVGGVLWWFVQGRGWVLSPQPEKLLAQAYTASRPFEFRMPDAGYSAVRQERGPESAIHRPSALLEAEVQIQRHLAANPQDPRFVELSAAADLLDGRFDPAIDSLEKIGPGGPQRLSELACAYALRAQAEHRSMDRAKAVDLLKRSLALDPRQPLAIFNLALLYEQMSLVPQAIDEWQDYLKLDKNSGWAGEARRHLATLRALKPLAKSNFDQPEAALDTFWTEWLPQADSNPQARTAALRLAKLFETRSQDASLRDALAISGSTVAPGLSRLSAAIRENQSGDYVDARSDALEAASFLAIHGAQAAALRARVEALYSLQRQELPDSCLTESRSLQHTLAGTSYAWMRGQARIVAGSCYMLSGRLSGARAVLEETSEQLQAASLPLLALRATGLLQDVDRSIAGPAAVFGESPQALQQCWSAAAPPLRIYQFYYDLAEASRDLGLSHAAAVFASGAVGIAEAIPNPDMRDLSRIWYANYLEQAGNDKAALAQALAVSRQFTSSPSTSDDVIRMEALLSVARLEIFLDKPQAALAQLNGFHRQSDRMPLDSLRRYYEVLGLAQDRLSHFDAARDALQSAIRIHERLLQSLSAGSERRAQRSIERAPYALLADLELNHYSNPQASLFLWSKYQSPLIGAQLASSVAWTLPPSWAAVIFCSRGDHLLAWMVDRQGIAARTEALLPVVEQQADEFLRLCSQPDSSLSEVRRRGAALFRLLFGEFEPRLAQARVWVIVPDEWIASLPFNALIAGNNRFAIEDHDLLVARSLFALHWNTASKQAFPLQKALVVGVPSAIAPPSTRLPYLADAERETAVVSRSFAHVQLLLGEQATLDRIRQEATDANVFHFVGHGWSNAGNGALLLDDPKQPSPVTADEISHENWRRCELAVLSACLTASGESRGPLNPASLVEAFMDAGARNVIAARWSVDSSATRSLMERFYGSLTSGSEPLTALGAAQRALIAQAEFTHPYYWAAYQLFGSS